MSIRFRFRFFHQEITQVQLTLAVAMLNYAGEAGDDSERSITRVPTALQNSFSLTFP